MVFNGMKIRGSKVYDDNVKYDPHFSIYIIYLPQTISR